MKQKLFLLITSISFFSCSQERLTGVADDILSVEEVSATTQSLLIDKDWVAADISGRQERGRVVSFQEWRGEFPLSL